MHLFRWAANHNKAPHPLKTVLHIHSFKRLHNKCSIFNIQHQHSIYTFHPDCSMQQSCQLNDLPEEIVSVIAECVGLEFLGLLQFVDSFFLQVCLRIWGKVKHGNRYYVRPFCSSVSLLEWMLGDGGYPEVRARSRCLLMTFAAGEGQIEVMEWLHRQNPPYPWGTEVCFAASEAGNLTALQWLRGQLPPCPWDQRSVEVAGGHIDILLWMKSLPETAFFGFNINPHLYVNGNVL